jgi:hypothetical protein
VHYFGGGGGVPKTNNVQDIGILIMHSYRFRWAEVQISEQQEFQRTFLEYLSKVRLLPNLIITVKLRSMYFPISNRVLSQVM